MSAIREFYGGAGRDGNGRTLEEILAWPDSRLEDVHDYIQWLFPLPEPSGANPWAPVLTEEDVREFRADRDMQARLGAAFSRMLRFYGLREQDGVIDKGPLFAIHAQNWLYPGNHNHLRITRILRSLRILGRQPDAAALWRMLEALYREEQQAGRYTITEQSFRFWQRAATQPLGGWGS